MPATDLLPVPPTFFINFIFCDSFGIVVKGEWVKQKISKYTVQADNDDVKIEPKLAQIYQRPSLSYMKTAWHWNYFRITGPLWWESTGHRWNRLTKAQQWGV